MALCVALMVPARTTKVFVRLVHRALVTNLCSVPMALVLFLFGLVLNLHPAILPFVLLDSVLPILRSALL